jgi:WD40 repeat protein
MLKCLNPHQPHYQLQPAPGQLVCHEPECGFLFADAPIRGWYIHSLLKQDKLMDLYLAVGAAGISPEKVLLRVIRRATSTLFVQSMRLQALRHPSIHPLLLVEKIAGGRMLCLLSSFEGQGSLAHFLEKHRTLSLPAIGIMVLQIAEALHQAHSLNIIHGHLTLENCLLIAPATLQVCDFYYSFLGVENLPLTPFAAPEQRNGQLVPASDQYALAALAYHLFKHYAPSSLRGSSAVTGGLTARAPLFSLSHPLDLALGRALSEQAAYRFSDMRAFMSAFRGALEHLRREHLLIGAPATSRPLQRLQSPVQVTRSHESALPSSPRTTSPLPEEKTGMPTRAIRRGLLPGHMASILALRWSPDGSILASSDEDNVIRLWLFHHYVARPAAIPSGHSSRTLALCWSPDGSLLASAGHDSSLCIWRVTISAADPLSIERSWWGHDGEATTLEWSPDGSRLLSGGRDGTIRLWDANGYPLLKQQVHAGKGTRCVRWSPDQRFIATAGADRQITVWDAALTSPLAHWEAHNDEVQRIEWSPHSYILASYAGKKDTRVCLWHAPTGQLLASIAHQREPVGLFWSEDGTWLATVALDDTLNFWQTSYLMEQRSLSRLFPALLLEQTPSLMCGSHASKLLAVASKTFSIAIYEFVSSRK